MKTKEIKRSQAMERNRFWELMPLKEKIAHLKTRHGKSEKQITRLIKRDA